MRFPKNSLSMQLLYVCCHYLLFDSWILSWFRFHTRIVFKTFFHFFHNYIIHVNFTCFIAMNFISFSKDRSIDNFHKNITKKMEKNKQLTILPQMNINLAISKLQNNYKATNKRFINKGFII